MIKDYFKDLATDRKRGFFAFVLKGFLWLLSLLYRMVIAVLSGVRGLNPAVFSSKVISVGNITWGGTGKTPLVALLADFLRNDGRKVAVLTRGYGRSVKDGQTIPASASGMGDEPYMLARKLRGIPVIVNSDRRAAAIEAQQKHGADTLILDDGFQQWGVHKDLDIVTIDAEDPFGNGHLIPRGILREPVAALRRADIFILTNAGASADMNALKTRLAGIHPSGLVVSARHKTAGLYMLADLSKECSPERAAARPAALVCAIGNPASFRRLAASLGIRVAAEFFFPDHHCYSQADIASVTNACSEQGIGTIITTEKDAVKLAPLAKGISKPDMLVLKVVLEIIENEEQFYRRLRGIYPA